MKKLMYYCLFCFVLIALSCKSNNDSNNNANNPIIVDSLIFGYWINIDYLETISKTKSPYTASKKNPYKVLKIIKDYLKGDTLKISWEDASLSEFPGYECYKIITPNTFEYIGYTYGDEEPNLKEYYAGDEPPPLHSLKLENGILSVIDYNNKVLKKYCLLTKKMNKENVSSEIVEIINENVNKELVEGKYKDINDQNKTISFLPNGKVEGFDKFDKYEVNIFFREDYGIFKNDFIEFSNSKADRDTNSDTLVRLDNKLFFEFEGNNLLLYEYYYDTIQKEEYPKLIKGNLKYKLKKL